jgi:hypothetical protein
MHEPRAVLAANFPHLRVLLPTGSSALVSRAFASRRASRPVQRDASFARKPRYSLTIDSVDLAPPDPAIGLAIKRTSATTHPLCLPGLQGPAGWSSRPVWPGDAVGISRPP